MSDSSFPLFAGLTLVAPPASDPVSVADAKAHSRIFIDADDSLIAGYISAATRKCEEKTHRAFMPQSWRQALNYFPGRNPRIGYRLVSTLDEYYKWNYIEIYKPPLRSIVAFTFTDSDGVVSNMVQVANSSNAAGSYLLDLEQEPGRVVLPFAGIWPTNILYPASPIKITFQAGYDSFSGAMTVDGTGAATWLSGDKFDPQMVGTWMTVFGAVSSPPTADITTAKSLAVNSYIDNQHITLQAIPDQIDTPMFYTANAVPMPIRQGILFLAAHFYETREPVVTGRGETAVEIPATLDDILSDYKARFET